MLEYKTEILNLASLLSKLTKVMRHSDPTADAKKKLIYSKYQQKVSELSREIKEKYSWNDLNRLLNNAFADVKISAEDKKLIEKKILKDLEQVFFTPQVLNNFDLTKPKKAKKVVLRRIKPASPKKAELKTRPVLSYTREGLLDMVSTNLRTRNARKELGRLIDAINKIGPDKLEHKINSLSKKVEE